MKLQMLAIKDRALDAFMRPFFAQSTGQAIRMFSDELNKKDTEMNRHPDDYDLWYLGEWDDNTGELTPNGGPGQLTIGKQLHIKEE